MADEPINLRQARKAKARAKKEQAAQTARALHGQTKSARQSHKAQTEKAAKILDAHRRAPRED